MGPRSSEEPALLAAQPPTPQPEPRLSRIAANVLYDEYLEQELLGAALCDQAALGVFLDLPNEALVEPHVRRCHELLFGLRASGSAVDPLILARTWAERGWQAPLGLEPVTHQVARWLCDCMKSMCSSANAAVWAGRIRRAWTLRELGEQIRLAYSAWADNPVARFEEISAALDKAGALAVAYAGGKSGGCG